MPVVSGYTGYSTGIWDFEIYQGRFYWTSWNSPYIRSTLLDGTDFRSIPTDGSRAFSLEIAKDQLFVGDTGYENILSMAMDGNDRHVLIANVDPVGMDIFEDRLYYNSVFDINSISLTGGTPRYEATTQNRISFQLTVVPEPGALLLLATACASWLAYTVWRRLQAAKRRTKRAHGAGRTCRSG